MEFKRRFVFRGNAAAFGGRLIRPEDLVIETSCSSSLGTSGGRSRVEVGVQRFGDEVQIGSAATFAEGLFDDAQQFNQLTYRRVAEDALTTSTRVHAEVRDVIIGRKPQLIVARLRAALQATSPTGSGETRVATGNDLAIDGVSIDGYKLRVDLDTKLFARYDTRAKLYAAADDPRFVREHGVLLLMQSQFEGRHVPSTGRLVGSGIIHATVVRQIRWVGRRFPGAEIDHHVVTVPNFGKLFFGELLIESHARRLTMLRLELGSPAAGRLDLAHVETDGGWSP